MDGLADILILGAAAFFVSKILAPKTAATIPAGTTTATTTATTETNTQTNTTAAPAGNLNTDVSIEPGSGGAPILQPPVDIGIFTPDPGAYSTPAFIWTAPQPSTADDGQLVVSDPFWAWPPPILAPPLILQPFDDPVPLPADLPAGDSPGENPNWYGMTAISN